MASGFEKEVKAFLGPRGPLTRLLPRYESRPEQADMAAAVLRSLSQRSILTVEAGTGTGKTLAYLVPAIYAGERVVISTGTKALQEQLIYKDLPVLMREFDIRAALMKGRTNYLCWKRFHEFSAQPAFKFRDEISFWDRIREWAHETETGDRAEIEGLPDDFSAWREITASGEQCTGQKCEYFDHCFVTRMRVMAQSADIIVVNHHLFFADLSIKDQAPSSIIPSYGLVIFDEAHSLSEIATEYFGVQVSTWRLMDLSQDLKRLDRASSIAVDDLRDMLAALEGADFAVSGVLKRVAEYGSTVGAVEAGRFTLERLRNDDYLLEEGERASSALSDLAAAVKKMAGKEESLSYLYERVESLRVELNFVLSQGDPDHVYWAEVRGRGVILRASPAELGPILEDRLFAGDMPMVFTSATLAVKDKKRWSFDHFKGELGLSDPGREVMELWLPSSYNWGEQAMLYVPRGLPDPTDGGFITEAAREMYRILKITSGRAFLLFTSYRNMEAAYELLAPHLDHPVFKQGEAPKSELLDHFRDEDGSVLFATQSFWEGVDVAGQALSCVVVDKLPFGSPGDPLMSAKIERIKRKGGNAFRDFQLPSAVISLKQGLGRLIRTRSDYGILAVMDKRILTKSYGKTFLQSLPPAPLTHDLTELEKFFRQWEEKGEKE